LLIGGHIIFIHVNFKENFFDLVDEGIVNRFARPVRIGCPQMNSYYIHIIQNS